MDESSNEHVSGAAPMGVALFFMVVAGCDAVTGDPCEGAVAA